MRKASAYIAAALGVLAFSPGGRAQQGSLKDADAVTVLGRAATAMGADAGKIKTAAASGTYTRFLPGGKTKDYTVRMIAAGPERVRWETESKDDKVIVVVEGNTGWMQSHLHRRSLSLSEITGSGIEKFPLMAMASWTNAPGIVLRYSGKTAGADLDQVTLSKSFGAVKAEATSRLLDRATRIDWFFDAKSGLPDRVRCYQNAMAFGDLLAVDLAFSDFKDLGGVLTPMTVTTYVGRQVVAVLRFAEVKLNVAIPMDDFKE
jgi:outer membrane lipoprotein-sorting protein